MGVDRPNLLALYVALAVAAVFALTAYRYYGLPADAAHVSASRFSGERAFRALDEVIGDLGAHPAGSVNNERARDRIVRRFTALGYTPTVTRRFVCGTRGACAFVENILVEREGSDRQHAVLLAAHYDSAPVGQGANDDGLGVATALETARLLKELSPPLHSILILLTDGEERGLLGAEAFASEDPTFTRVSAFVNVEARGSSGPSLLFETTDANAYVMQVVAKALERPITSSLFSAIYQRMPNDTDFTVWKRRGAVGVNFAVIGSLSHYHTALDRMGNIDRGTLAHQGENACAATLALANAPDLGSSHAGSLVWFDVFGFFVCTFAPWLALTLACVSFAMLVFGVLRRLRARELSRPSLGVGLLVVPLALLVAALLSLGAGFVQGSLGFFPAPWIAHPFPLLLAFALVALFALTSVARVLVRRATPTGLWMGSWLTVAAMGVALSVGASGASYLFVVPLFVAACTSFFARSHMSTTRSFVVIGVPLIAALMVWAPLLLMLYDALGFTLIAAHGIVWALALLPLIPLLGNVEPRLLTRAAFGMLMGAVVAIVSGKFSPPFSAQHPARANVVFHQDAVGSSARVLLDTSWGVRSFGVYPESMRRAMGSPFEEQSFAWLTTKALSQRAPRIAVDAPELTVLTDRRQMSGRDVRVRIRSLRGAQTLGFLQNPESDMRVLMANQLATSTRELPSGWRAHTFYAVPPEGIELFLQGSIAPADAILLDMSEGVPESAAPVVRARPSTAVPSQDGDTTLLTRRVRF